MTGSAAQKPKFKDPDPVPEPVLGREEEQAKKRVTNRRGGRQANILAGRMTAQRNDILKTRLG